MVAPGQVAAVVEGVNQQVRVEIVAEVTLRITLPQDVELAVSSTQPNGEQIPVDADGSLVVYRGATLQVTGSGFAPNSLVDVWIYSTPTRLGSILADSSGSILATFEVPATIAPGDHNIKLDGRSADGELVTISIGVRVRDAVSDSTSSTDSKPATVSAPEATGNDTAGATGAPTFTPGILVGMAIVLIFAMFGGVLVARRLRLRSASGSKSRQDDTR